MFNNKYKVFLEGYTDEHKAGINAILQSCSHIKILKIEPLKINGCSIVQVDKIGKNILKTLQNADCLYI